VFTHKKRRDQGENMSLDLALLPYNYPDHEFITFSHTVLPIQTNNRDLMDAITKASYVVQPQSVSFIKGNKEPNGDVEDNFTCYLARDEEGETCYGTVTEDAYGKPLRWVGVSELLKIDKKLWRNPQDKAALAYITTMHKDHRIALYWS